MASSKKDFYVVSKLILEVVNSLTEEQFSNLVNGTADLKYIEKSIDSDKKEKYNLILFTIANKEGTEEKIKFIKETDELSTKTKMIEFCKYFKIDYKVKDSVDEVIKNIVMFSEGNKDSIIYKYSRIEDIQLGIDEIAKKLEECMDVEEGKNLIDKSKIVESRVNLFKLAKKLNVFISNRDASYDVIRDTIIKSVVEAKIRSFTIRNKI